jgi:uncharacterized damage-inducible protein DinB
MLKWFKKISHCTMKNLQFFSACMANELKATYDTIAALPANNLEYRPHPVNRSGYEIMEHIVAHVYDFEVILKNSICDEKLNHPIESPYNAAEEMTAVWNRVQTILNEITEEQWEKETVELLVAGKPLVTLPRSSMMWFFFFDIIHHRGQLSSYLRPMGGKNPAIYGYSADTLSQI